MKFDFLSLEARRAVIAAQRLARGRGEEEVELEHLLSVLGEIPEATEILRQAGVDLEALSGALQATMATFAKLAAPQIYLGDRLLRVLDAARIDARQRGSDLVEPVHLLLALAGDAEASAAGVLRSQKVDRAALEKAAARQGLVGRRADAPATDGDELRARYPRLQRFARDLTALAEARKLDPVIGRHGEIRRVLQILGRRNKNSPILIGEPGVGKTALVEGLAQRIIDGDVPARWKGLRVFALDIGALVAGARFRGEFEERVRGVIDEVREAAGEILVFIDEIHTLVGAGKGDGSLDAASLLKPALARGEIAVIGATTIEEYRRYLEKDAAFERRFAPVLIEEPDDETCLAMLRGLKTRYERAHDVFIEDEALVAAVHLSRRYVSGRALPDKALDLLDEASSRLRLELDSHPDELDALQRDERGLLVKLEGLSLQGGASGKPSRAEIESRLAAVREKLNPLREKWQAELDAIKALQKAVTTFDAAVENALQAEKTGQLETASRIRFGDLPELEKAVAVMRADLVRVSGDAPLLEAAVAKVHVARVVEDWTGIPVTRMLEGERTKILSIEDRLCRRVIGQDRAVALVGHAIKRSRAGLADPGRPIGSFLFLGPTGVGKTELAKALAEFLFDDENALVRLDMSEYMEKHAVARLTGAPPGYVGYEDGGQLTEAVRRKPYSVVLLDEVEKAHPDVFNVLLAVLDDGRLTDSSGRTVNFSNTVLIMTSNLASQAILDAARDGRHDRIAGEVQAAVRSHFRPEFLNRIDETVLFDPLSQEIIARIVDLQVARLDKLLAEYRLTLRLDEPARTLLARLSYDPAFGARPVKRVIGRQIRNVLAESILQNRFAPGDTIAIGVTGDGEALTFTRSVVDPARTGAEPA